MLGYRGHLNWRDMSEYAVHFTKSNGSLDAYSVMLRILASGRLKAGGPFGAARGLKALGETQQSICFSEVPLDRLDRMVARRSKYGIAFTQRFLIHNGGARVWYVDGGGRVAETIRGMVSSRAVPRIDTNDDFWRLTPFVDHPSKEQGYQFEWEREWRVPGDMQFEPDDVAFLFLPEELHSRARSFFQDAIEENTGPVYLCPYLDPLWSDARIQDALTRGQL
ncbi:hypothetical protein [Ornithinimicrobium cerasi]|uniref:Abortive phage resistance protein AbiGi, antitoxin n=1 Tax=Ornithinimicrobium cerasi TaxID=2248773 RepID=A0A285VAG0_9MICO|nr:hypothetical protein [Ornithinimicrobium cerasi]SOC51105.1 hypothetical protein SAMN05421879_10127 [Ornithinimicrobium cerasi]